MTDLLINKQSKKQLDALVRGHTHAILITGGAGMGKKTVARWLAAALLDIPSLHNQPYVLELGVADSEKAIGIEQIRGLRQFVQRTTTGTGRLRRACLLFGADTMTSESANALLKTLEEPPDDTVIILTATSEVAVPSTICSRVQTVALLPIPLKSAQEYSAFTTSTAQAIAQAHRLAGGRPGLMAALLAGDSDHELGLAVDQAKQVLTMDTYHRLCMVDVLSKDKQQCQAVLFGLERIAYSLVNVAAEQEDAQRLKRMHGILQRVAKAQQALEASASTKLVLTDLFMNM